MTDIEKLAMKIGCLSDTSLNALALELVRMHAIRAEELSDLLIHHENSEVMRVRRQLKLEDVF